MSQYTSFGAHFSMIDSFLRCLIVMIFALYCFGLGSYLIKKWDLTLPQSFIFGLGIVVFNILLVPLFFLKLFHGAILLLFFFLLSFPAGKGLATPWTLRSEKIDVNVHSRHLELFLIVIPLLFHFLEALMPVSYQESFGDIASNYLKVPMSFAAAHGAVQTPLLAGTIAQFVNFELMSSMLITLANPEIVKIFGFMLFTLSFFMLRDFLKELWGSKWSTWNSLILLISPFFIDKFFFSFAHPRVYVLFLSSLALFLTYIGHKRAELKYHLAALVVIGVLAGTNYQGGLYALINLFLIISDLSMWRGHLRAYLSFGVFALLLTVIFPFWVYLCQGSPFPALTSFNEALGFRVHENLRNSWLTERYAMAVAGSPGVTMVSFLGAFSKILFEQVGLLVVFLAFGAFLIREWPVKFFLAYYLSHVLLLLVIIPSLIEGGVNSRFLWISVPFLLSLLTYIMNRTSEWMESHQAGRDTSSLWCAILAKRGLIFSTLIVVSLFYITTQSLEILTSKHILPRKWEFFTGRIDLRGYLGNRYAAIIEFLNGNFNSLDRVLYLFRVFPGIYSQPELHAPIWIGSAAIIYRSLDKTVIMDKIKEMGLGFMCLDNRFELSANQPWWPIVSEVVTPIFEPEFFARHFVPLETRVPKFYCFRIDYEGLTAQSKIEANFDDISATGFFHLIYESINKSAPEMIHVKANPYSPETLLSHYEKVKERIYQKKSGD
ncbi:MAG: hypothetical protein HY730_01140 [Candidatus Tectomicrobia bacterium]|uniref:Uncharacterized protein n=1 Tax=Tectimicrobiota bacterium TaxID=2528274 RepID=A0A933GJF1_UNCTE|nr:hypothetical protein [Candidatus Tectomicrobia bacterium]